MYVERIKCRRGGKVYTQVLVRESYREKSAGRSRVKHRTLLNITRFPKVVQDAMAMALREPERMLEGLTDARAGELELHEGKSVGAVWAVMQVAQRLGVVQALGRGRPARLALWQVIARVLEQGSRLSAVRLHDRHALAQVIGLDKGFNEDDLYDNLAWLSERQARIEKRLFKARRKGMRPSLFLYDVTSSYFEGDCNELAAYGYNRDKKKGKKQIVVGLLCDEYGEPVSAEVFAGNTRDPATLGSQVRKTAERFGCQTVTFVGDRGMIKSGQVKELKEAGFHYITAITKPQIEKLLKDGALQMELFEQKVCEVAFDGKRLVLRRNPVRAQELAASRADKKQSVEAFATERTTYLAEHPRAKTDVALRRVRAKIRQLRLDKWLRIEVQGRELRLKTDQASLEYAARLDGCYVISTDLQAKTADAQTVHDRYRDLAQVERGFRVCKTVHLQLRPIYVRTAKSTRGHVFVVMLAYLIRRELERAWAALDLTVEEGLAALTTLCTIRVMLGADSELLRVPTPREQSRQLLEALALQPPSVLPYREVRVATKRTLPERRLNH